MTVDTYAIIFGLGEFFGGKEIYFYNYDLLGLF